MLETLDNLITPSGTELNADELRGELSETRIDISLFYCAIDPHTTQAEKL